MCESELYEPVVRLAASATQNCAALWSRLLPRVDIRLIGLDHALDVQVWLSWELWSF